MFIPKVNFSAVMLLCEVELNCKLIAKAGISLHEAAAYWVALGKGIDNGKRFSPIEIISFCSVCLGSAAAISRILFLGDRKGKKAVRISRRCETLMRILGEPKLPVIKSFLVRNSWEHMDERLDDLLERNVSSSYEEIHIAVKPPDKSTFFLRHFDPARFEIKYGSDSLFLELLLAEAECLSACVNTAFKELKTSDVHIY